MSSADVFQNCRAACRAAVDTVLDSSPSWPDEHHRAWEGFSYEPTTGEAFVEDKLSSNDSRPVAIGAIDHEFSYILTLKWPSDEGTADVEGLAGVILDAFRVGTKLTAGGQTFLCYSAKRRGAIVQETDWQVLTVVVSLQTFTTE